MKPTDEQLTVIANNAPKKDATNTNMNVSTDMSIFDGADMTVTESLKKLDDALIGKAFLQGTAPSKDDAELLEKVLKADANTIASYKNVSAWTNLISMFAPEVRSGW